MQNTYSPLPPRKGKKDEMFCIYVEEEVRALSHPHGRFAGWLNARQGAVGWQLVSWEKAGEAWGCFVGCSLWPPAWLPVSDGWDEAGVRVCRYRELQGSGKAHRCWWFLRKAGLPASPGCSPI